MSVKNWERLRTEMTSSFGCISLFQFPPIHCKVQGFAHISLVLEQRWMHRPFVSWMKMWRYGIEGPQQSQGHAGTSECWQVGWGTLLGLLSPPLCGDWWTGLPSHHCGLCCPSVRRVIYRASFPWQRLKYSSFVVLRAFLPFQVQ